MASDTLSTLDDAQAVFHVQPIFKEAMADVSLSVEDV